MYCTDADLLKWEPRLAAEAADAAQTLFNGLAEFDRATLALAPLDPACTHASAVGAIAVLDDGECFTIAWSCRPDAMRAPRDLRLAVRTFAAQRRIVSDLLARIAKPAAAADDLRRAAVLGTLHAIYATLAAAAAPGREADTVVRRELYERLYRRALTRVVAAFVLDEEGDEVAARGRPRLLECAAVD